MQVPEAHQQHGARIKGKLVGIIISGKEAFESSARNAIEYLKRVSGIYGIEVVGDVFGRAEVAGEVSKNSDAIRSPGSSGESWFRE